MEELAVSDHEDKLKELESAEEAHRRQQAERRRPREVAIDSARRAGKEAIERVFKALIKGGNKTGARKSEGGISGGGIRVFVTSTHGFGKYQDERFIPPVAIKVVDDSTTRKSRPGFYKPKLKGGQFVYNEKALLRSITERLDRTQREKAEADERALQRQTEERLFVEAVGLGPKWKVQKKHWPYRGKASIEATLYETEEHVHGERIAEVTAYGEDKAEVIRRLRALLHVS
jgi:hypothetical protein